MCVSPCLHEVLGHLAKEYVDTISSGGMPCLENAVVTISELENKAAVEDGTRVYQTGMEQLKQSFPVELTVVSAEHQRLYTMAIQTFMNRCFKDDEGKYLNSLEVGAPIPRHSSLSFILFIHC